MEKRHKKSKGIAMTDSKEWTEERKRSAAKKFVERLDVYNEKEKEIKLIGENLPKKVLDDVSTLVEKLDDAYGFKNGCQTAHILILSILSSHLKSNSGVK